MPPLPAARLVQVVLPEAMVVDDIESIAVHGAIELSVDAPVVKEQRKVAFVRAAR